MLIMGYRFRNQFYPLESIVELLILTTFTQMSATYISWLFQGLLLINYMYTTPCLKKKKVILKKSFAFLFSLMAKSHQIKIYISVDIDVDIDMYIVNL